MFEIGDPVQLISGGPAMTVQDVCRLTGDYKCVWFNGCIKQQSSFPEKVLQVYTPPKDDDENGGYGNPREVDY